jgi:hypothetical protein
MGRISSIFITAFVLALVCSDGLAAQDNYPLRLVQTIPMPNVNERIDQMDVDVKGKRLFVAGVENGSLEVVDLGAGKWSKSIPDFASSMATCRAKQVRIDR